MKILRNQYVLMAALALAGSGLLAVALKWPPQSVIGLLLLILLCLCCFLLVPKCGWLAKQLRYRDFVRDNGPFETLQESWEKFEKQDSAFNADDPIMRRWQELVDAKLEEAPKEEGAKEAK